MLLFVLRRSKSPAKFTSKYKLGCLNERVHDPNVRVFSKIDYWLPCMKDKKARPDVCSRCASACILETEASKCNYCSNYYYKVWIAQLNHVARAISPKKKRFAALSTNSLIVGLFSDKSVENDMHRINGARAAPLRATARVSILLKMKSSVVSGRDQMWFRCSIRLAKIYFCMYTSQSNVIITPKITKKLNISPCWFVWRT